MTWVRLDDGFYNHPKVAGLGQYLVACVGLHVLALCYSSTYLTDGFIPEGQVGRLTGDLGNLLRDGGVELLVDRLVAVNLWEKTEGGWIIHDFLDYNPSKKEVLQLRENRAKIGKKGGQAKAVAKAKQNASNALANEKQPPTKPPTKSLATAKQTPTKNEAKVYPVPVPVPVPVPLPQPEPEPEKNAVNTLGSQTSRAVENPTPTTGSRNGSSNGHRPSEITRLLTAFDEKFRAKFSAPHPPFGGAEAKLAQSLIKTYGLEKLLIFVEGFFMLKTPWLQEAGYTFRVFNSQVGKLVMHGDNPWLASLATKTRANVEACVEAAKLLEQAEAGR